MNIRKSFPATPILYLLLASMSAIVFDAEAQDMRKMELVYTLPAMEQVEVQTGIPYKSVGENEWTLDYYAPPSLSEGDKLPAVIFALGYPDFKLNRMQSYISWGELVASQGMIGINYETGDPVTDLRELVAYIRENADSLNIDEDRIGIWSCSANVPAALDYLYGNTETFLKFGVFYYGFMNTPDGRYQTQIDSLSNRFGYASPIVKESEQLPDELPLLVVRAGKETYPYVNASIDHFTAMALSNNMDVTLVNYRDGQHAFDIMDDTDESRRIIAQTLSFMRERFREQK